QHPASSESWVAHDGYVHTLKCYVIRNLPLNFTGEFNYLFNCSLKFVIMIVQDQPIARKRSGGFKKFLWWFVIILLLAGGILLWWKYFYVFGEGVKSGELNYLVKKGNIFKTYEGKLIQSGLRSRAPGTVQSYE